MRSKAKTRRGQKFNRRFDKTLHKTRNAPELPPARFMTAEERITRLKRIEWLTILGKEPPEGGHHERI